MEKETYNWEKLFAQNVAEKKYALRTLPTKVRKDPIVPFDGKSQNWDAYEKFFQSNDMTSKSRKTISTELEQRNVQEQFQFCDRNTNARQEYDLTYLIRRQRDSTPDYNYWTPGQEHVEHSLFAQEMPYPRQQAIELCGCTKKLKKKDQQTKFEIEKEKIKNLLDIRFEQIRNGSF